MSIGGLPEGARLLDGDGNEVDPVGITSDMLSGLSLVPPQDFSGEITLTVTATSQDGDSTADSTGSDGLRFRCRRCADRSGRQWGRR